MKSAALLFVTLLVGVSAAWAEEKPKAGSGDRHGPPSFKDMDANNDGSVSLGEFTEAQQKQIEWRFHFLDSNNDGKLSQGEIESGRERMKKHFDDRRDGDHAEPK
jgi:hypothetical protein